MGGIFRAPKAPDPYATAAAQGAMNEQTARTQFGLNAYDQYTPYGNTIWTNSPGTDRWQVTQTLAPSEQRQLDLTNQAQELYGQAGVQQLQRLQGTLSQPFTPTYGTREAVTDALMARMAPSMERDRANLEARLANQGIGLGSAAWNAGMDDFNRAQNDARLAAILQGGNEASAQLQRDIAVRNQPLNEVAALLTGQQVQMPGQIAGPQVQIAPGDLQGAVMGNYAARTQQYGANMGALGGLGGSLLGGWARGGFGFGGR